MKDLSDEIDCQLVIDSVKGDAFYRLLQCLVIKFILGYEHYLYTSFSQHRKLH